MGKLHELLAVEETVVKSSEQLLAETNKKFVHFNEFFTGHLKTLKRIAETEQDKAIEAAQRKNKDVTTSVPEQLGYVFPFFEKSLSLKLSKHLTNQKAVGTITLDGVDIAKDVPVDFLLDLEKIIPRWRATFVLMPTTDPGRKWETVVKGYWKSDAGATVQTERIMVPVVLAEATKEHPAQVKESTKDIVVGTWNQVDFSGAATSQQKADILTLCDNLLVAVKQARMRANETEQVKSDAAKAVLGLFTKVFD